MECSYCVTNVGFKCSVLKTTPAWTFLSSWCYFYMVALKCQHTAIRFLKTKIVYFSSLPYSVFGSSLLFQKLKQKSGITWTKFRYQSLLVSLRAPKHFKVGRQQVNVPKRCITIVTKSPEKSGWQPINTPKTSIFTCINVIKSLQTRITAPPLTTVKSFRVSLAYKIRYIQ